MLELDGLSKRYGETVALDDLWFSVAEGQVFGFVGPNGAGKTTAMRIVLGVLAQDAGEVRWRGALAGGPDLQPGGAAHGSADQAAPGRATRAVSRPRPKPVRRRGRTASC
jgi:ABC-type branched-subunit amino acid transport system ATPase component